MFAIDTFLFFSDEGLSSDEIAGIVIGVLAVVLLLAVGFSVAYVKLRNTRHAERQALNMNFENPTYAKEEGPINDMFNSPYTQIQRTDSVDSVVT